MRRLSRLRLFGGGGNGGGVGDVGTGDGDVVQRTTRKTSNVVMVAVIVEDVREYDLNGE